MEQLALLIRLEFLGDDGIGEDFLGDFGFELGEDLFTSWFARMEIEELEQERLSVSVPTRFLKSWIETHYLSKLLKISEADAFRWIQKTAMDRRMGMREVADAVVAGMEKA